MSRFLRLAQFSGSHSINLPQLKSFTFGPYLSCPGCLPLFKSPSLLPVPFPSPRPSGSPSCRVTLDRPVPEAGPDFRIALHQPSPTETLHFPAQSILSRLLASVQITIPPAGTVPIAQLQRLAFLPGHSRSTGTRGWSCLPDLTPPTYLTYKSSLSRPFHPIPPSRFCSKYIHSTLS